jgi:dienelactone hydrolase
MYPLRPFALFCALLSAILSAQTPPPPAKRLPPAGIVISSAARAELTAGAATLRADLDVAARELTENRNHRLAALLPDAEVFHKAVDWALRYDEVFDAKQIAVARRALASGRARVAELRAGRAPWLEATGLIVRGHRSQIDDSIQPYGLFVPASLPRDRPARLMVWLLGRGEKRTELAFLAEREAGPPQLTPRDTLLLIPYGRYCNATKFAGETDVFEALAATRAHYNIDPDRIGIAGFSMGGASTWHLATHHAGRWCFAAPGAGFAETPVYAKVLAPGKEPPTAWERTLWHWYNATDYAANLFNCPTVAYSGEIDPQKQAADIMAQALTAEGLPLEHLIGPQTAHKYHPESKQALTTRLEALADRGRDPRPPEIRLTTHTLRYPGRSWLQFEGLEKHWARADLTARREGKSEVVVTTKNTTAFNVLLPGLRSVRIDGQTLSLPDPAGATASFHRDGPDWRIGTPDSPKRKRHGLTGPIDDAFLGRFIFVRPTGRALNERLGAWTQAELAHAAKLWRDLFRGEPLVRDDTEVSPADLASSHLVLWGDPTSNRLLARILPQLPLQWDAQSLVFRGRTYNAAHHAPVLIFPNPLNPDRYVVLNSGIDFREHGYGTNSLQVPKLPDYAIVDLREPPGPRWPGKIVTAGFFNEEWR